MSRSAMTSRWAPTSPRIDRAALDTTHVGSGAKLDNLVQVGHAAQVGPHSLMVAFSGVAGSARLGKGVVLAAKAAVLGHLSIGDGTRVGVASAVTLRRGTRRRGDRDSRRQACPLAPRGDGIR